MKITMISKLFCAFALCVSLMSFNSAEEKDGRKDKSSKASFDASVLPLGKSFKVKLAVDKGTDEKLRIILRDKGGKTYYSEMFSRKDEPYRRTFDLSDMTDGTYYFDLYYNNQKLTKEVEIQTNSARTISLQ